MKKKNIHALVIAITLAALLIPIRMNLKDGGSVKYKALLYEVTKIHQLSNAGGNTPYIDGIEIRLLGMTVFQKITSAP